MFSEIADDNASITPLPPLASKENRTPLRARTFLALTRIALTYLYRHHLIPNLTAPRTFNELVQHRKLHDRDPRLPPLTDKIRAKALVAARIGSEWIIPTLWQGTSLPECPDWSAPFVIKSRHGCNQNIFVHDLNAVDWRPIIARTREWMATDYGKWLDEWAYSRIPRGLLIEPFIGSGPALPIDYKLFVFGGRVEYIQVHLGRGTPRRGTLHGRPHPRTGHRWIVMDRRWQRRSSPTLDSDPARPQTLSRMIAAAEELARSVDFARVDLYEIDGHPLFGEMTFYPGSGLCRFDPISLDREMGTHWLRAKGHTL